MAEATRVLNGLRILVVEDNFLIAETLKIFLEDCGCIVVGPIPRLAPAVDVVDSSLDGALLDMNLAGEYCFPIAKKLQGLRIPFVFVTGYGDRHDVPAEFRDVPRLSKPLDEERAKPILAATFCVE